MTRATYATIPALIATRTPFTHGSCHAFTDEHGAYRVFSYSTQIAYYGDAKECQRLFDLGWLTTADPIWVNEVKYSVTTSRLQNIIRKAWAI